MQRVFSRGNGNYATVDAIPIKLLILLYATVDTIHIKLLILLTRSLPCVTRENAQNRNPSFLYNHKILMWNSIKDKFAFHHVA